MHRIASPWSAIGSIGCAAALSTALAAVIPTQAEAKITIGIVQGASNYVRQDATDVLPAQNVIYGGVAGPATAGACASAGPNQTCNNCVSPGVASAYPDATGARFIPCNQNRIRGSSLLTVTFTSDTGAGYPIMLSKPTGGTTGVRIGNPGVRVAKGGTATLSIQWDDLCGAATSNTTGTVLGCEAMGVSAASVPVTVGISVNSTDFSGTGGATGDANDESELITLTVGSVGTTASLAPETLADFSACDTATVGANGGVCGYYLTPGDAKANVKDVLAATSFPLQFTGLSFRSVRFFYVAGGAVGDTVDTTPTSPFGTIDTGTSTYYDLAVASDGLTKSLTTSRIMGLSNDQRYYVKSAMVDIAGNVAYFQPDDSDFICSANYPLSGTPNANECHTVTPSEVLGVLEKDLNCFIATASYGSIMAPQVETFRRFRDQILKPTEWGRAFVRAYYRHSPRFARIIADSDSLRFVSRAALSPLLGYAWLSLKVGAINAALLIAALFALPCAGLRLAARRRARLSHLARLKDWKGP